MIPVANLRNRAATEILQIVDQVAIRCPYFRGFLDTVPTGCFGTTLALIELDSGGTTT